MAFPVLAKTHRLAYNIAIAAQGTQLATNRRLARTLKNTILGLAGAPFTCRYSSSGSVAGSAGDGIDRWAADTDLVSANAGAPHSWMVFRSLQGWEFLWTWEAVSGSLTACSMWASGAGLFTGGTVSARPTASDEFQFLSNSGWGGSNDVAWKLHVDGASDGGLLRVEFATGGTVTYSWHMFRPIGDVPALWVNPLLCRIAPQSANLYTAATVLNNSNYRGRGLGGAPIDCSLTTEGRGSSGALAQAYSAPGPYREGWPMSGMGIQCMTPGHIDQLGIVPDMWWSVDAATLANGTLTPDAPAAGEFVKLGGAVFPHDGSAAFQMT